MSTYYSYLEYLLCFRNTLKKPLGKQMSLQTETDVLKDKGLVKRTKSSLWKFRKHDDVLEGMSLWRHRSLVDVTKEDKEKTFTYVKDINIDYDEDKESTLVNNDDESCIVVTDFKMRKDMKGNDFSLRSNKKPDLDNEMKRKSISSNMYEIEKPLVKREQVRRYYRDYTTDTEDIKHSEDVRRKNRESLVEKDMYDMKLNVNLDKRNKKDSASGTKQNNEQKRDKSSTLQRETPDRKLVEDQKRISREIERLRNGEFSKNNNTLKDDSDRRKSNGYKMMNGNASNGVDETRRKNREYNMERGSYDKLNNMYDDEDRDRRNYTLEKENEVKQKWKDNYMMMGYNERNELNKRYSIAVDSKIKPEYIEDNRRYNAINNKKVNNRKIETESEDDWYDSWDEK